MHTNNTNIFFTFRSNVRWLHKNPALKEIDEKHEFFRGLMTRIGKELRHRATWKKVFLSIGSAAFSMIDVVTDIANILFYKAESENDVANLMIAFIMLSLALQLMLVVAVHHENKKMLLNEIAGTLSFTKAGFNKFRVLTNAKTIGHQTVPPVTEMMMFKLCEIFAESIPMVSATKLNEIAFFSR